MVKKIKEHPKNIFVMIKYHYQPIMQNGEQKWQTTEVVEFVEKINNTQLLESTTIIDIKNEKLIKNRTGVATYSQMMEYIQFNYPEHYEAIGKLLIEEKEIEEKTDTD